MKQQINLYVPRSRQAADTVSWDARRCGVILLIVIALLLLAWFYTDQNTRQLEQRVQALQAQDQQLQQQLAKVRAEHPPVKTSVQLQTQLQALTAEINAKRRYGAELQALQAEPVMDFSTVLSGLIIQPDSGVRLSRIQLQDELGQLSLQGRARSAEQVPIYLQGLARSPGYSQSLFDNLQLQHSGGAFSFTVAVLLSETAL